jgi:Ca-activated chloride channel family protein
MKALRYPQTAPYGEYGLGLVSLSLNEGNAALDRFAAAQKALRSLSGENHRDLRYRISYNRGIVYFEKEDFGEAARQFRNALEIDGTRVEAKRNLELSLLALSRAGTPVSSPADLVSGPGGNEILFDYIRQKEQNQWKSREWIEDVPASGPDY